MGQNCIISTLHFSVLDDDRLKREAFRQAVYYIDVETSSQCNRKCLYCPNSVNDRLSANQFMDDTVFVSFIITILWSQNGIPFVALWASALKCHRNFSTY